MAESQIYVKFYLRISSSPLPGKDELRRRFTQDELHREAWRSLVEEPLGCAIERHLQDDLLRGIVFTDAKIGLFTHPHDASLLQNRCFLYHTHRQSDR